MYKSIFKLQSDCIDIANQKLFTPFINCYELHSSRLNVNGVSYEEGIDYSFSNEWTNWIGGFSLDISDSILFDIDYFYIRKHDIDVLSFLVDATYANQMTTKEIVSKHYVEGQFSLDNGLYKNAVLNFGTVLEGLLNKSLTNTTLANLISSYSGGASTSDMTTIRQFRNKVHPNQISLTQDITRTEAVDARNNLERILKNL